MSKKRILVGAVCILIISWATPGAWAMGANVVFQPTTGNPSDQFTVVGQMFHPNEKVFINWRFSSATLAQAQADSNGSFSVTVKVPSDAHSGPNSVIIAGDQGSGVSLDFTVGGPTQEPIVGSDAQPWFFGGGGIAVGLLLGGLLFRRKSK